MPKPNNWRKPTDQQIWGTAFKRRRLEDTPKARRLEFIKTRFNKRKCQVCRKVSHYKVKRFSWCKEHLPLELRNRLSLEWQMRVCILPLADAYNRLGKFK